MDKKSLRKHFSALRRQNYTLEKCDAITEKILTGREYNTCSQLFVYSSYNYEADTQKIIDNCLDTGKKIALPYVTDKAHTMVFVYIKDKKELVKNKYGIYEPVFDLKNIAVSDENTFIIVPGLAFDRQKNRLGYGGGYYDKYLSENTYMQALGIGFQCQLIPQLETEITDIKLDMIMTEEETL